MTGRGLYNALEKFPDSFHVLEDMEQITRDRGAQGVLRSALWGQRREGGKGPMERPGHLVDLQDEKLILPADI